MKSRHFSSIGLLVITAGIGSVLLLTPSGRENGCAQAQSIDPGIVTEAIRPMHLPVEEAVASISREYQEFLTVNPSRNLMLFKGPEEILAELLKDIGLIDSRPSHVRVELQVVLLTQTAEKRLCIDRESSEKTAENSGDRQGASASEASSASLDTLIEQGEAIVLANSNTLAMSGKESSLKARETLNYFFNEGIGVANRPVVKKSDISADTEGQVAATLLPDGDIHLKVDVEVGSFTLVPESGLPKQRSHHLTTEITVPDGQTVNIGGLRPYSVSRTMQTEPREANDLPVSPAPESLETEDRHGILTLFVTAQAIQAGVD